IHDARPWPASFRLPCSPEPTHYHTYGSMAELLTGAAWLQRSCWARKVSLWERASMRVWRPPATRLQSSASWLLPATKHYVASSSIFPATTCGRTLLRDGAWPTDTPGDGSAASWS